MRHLQSKFYMHTVCNPQFDGQAKKIHKYLSKSSCLYLHALFRVSAHPCLLLSLCYDSLHPATKLSHFAALYGFSPLTPPDFLDSFKPFDRALKIRDPHVLVSEDFRITVGYLKHVVTRRAIALIESADDGITQLTCQPDIR